MPEWCESWIIGNARWVNIAGEWFLIFQGGEQGVYNKAERERVKFGERVQLLVTNPKLHAAYLSWRGGGDNG